MSFKALDHSTRLTDPAGFARAAKETGFAAVLRYLPLPPGVMPGDRVGRLTLEERIAMHAGGLGVGIIYERDTEFYHRPLDGAPAGAEDGPIARAAANALGFPPDHPIFGAADFNPTDAELPTIAAYMEAGGFEPYGNGRVCTYMAARGASHFWLMNWGGAGYSDPHIHQQGGQVTVAGVICDRNDGYYEDCIWWPPVAQPQPVPQPTGGENVHVDAKIQASNIRPDGTGWIDVPVPDGSSVISAVMNGSDAMDQGGPLPNVKLIARPGPVAGHWRVNFQVPGPMDIRLGLG